MKLKMLIKSVIVFTSLNIAVAANASQVSTEIPYYGNTFYQGLSTGISNDDLITSIKTVLRSYHVHQDGGMDQIVSSCVGQKGCYAHTKIGYDGARVWLMGKFYLAFDQKSQKYSVKDMYCDNYKSSDEFSSSSPGPDKVPDNTVINIEHTWPQSRFSGRFDKETQKSDLHHLFPTDSKLNATRGNYWFGEVSQDKANLKCAVSRFGTGTSGNQLIFEPPDDHKGRVARALFYFSLRYDMDIGNDQEAILKKWNHEHPVDEEEARRNDEIFKAQGNRNPFVDYPELADSIADF